MNRFLSSLVLGGVLASNAQASNDFIETLKINYDYRNYWMGDGSVATGVVIDETSMSIIGAGIKFNEKLLELSLNYETTLEHSKEDTPAIFEEQNDFSYTQVSLRPFSFVNFKNIEIEYENLSTSTSGEIKQGYGGKIYYDDQEINIGNLPAGSKIPLNYDITEFNVKYFFGASENPGNWYIGYREVTSQQPYIETASSTSTAPEHIRLDETFESQQLQIGFKKEFSALEKGFNIKEFRFSAGPATITSNYDTLSGTTSEVDWANNIYLEPALKLSSGDSSLYLSAYYGYDVVYFAEDEAKGGGDVISETSEYGFKIYYTF